MTFGLFRPKTAFKQTKSPGYLSFPQIPPLKINLKPQLATVHCDALLTILIARDESTSIIKLCCVRGTDQPAVIAYKETNAAINFGAVTDRTDTRTNETECGTCNGLGTLVELKAVKEIFGKAYPEKTKPKGSEKKGSGSKSNWILQQLWTVKMLYELRDDDPKSGHKVKDVRQISFEPPYDRTWQAFV
ncbi:hypothetical protein EAF04_009730 [Stromatinia cepivora]|nr:hypothetical protein EAF04_009730 [Stromatinia cepivora]